MSVGDATTVAISRFGQPSTGWPRSGATCAPPTAAPLDKTLDELAATVCRDDPRTKTQRRADAIGAWSQGESSLPCECGSKQCSAPAPPQTRSGGVEIQVIAEAATIEGTSDRPGLLPGYGAISAARVRELAKKATLRPVAIPKTVSAEPQYRPSAGMARLIRCRDLGCRWPNCNAPACRNRECPAPGVFPG